MIINCNGTNDFMKKDAATSLVEMPSKSIIEAEGLLKRAIDRWENEGGEIVPPIIVCGSIDNLLLRPAPEDWSPSRIRTG